MSTSANIQIRPATPEDVPQILAFIRELGEYERLAHEVVATAAGLAEQLFGAQPAAEVLIAEVDGQSAGFALFFRNFSTFLAQPGLYLEDLYVRPALRGHGVGKRLMSHLAQLAIQRGYGRFEWSVLDWNAPAIGFYRRIGAIGLEQWTVQRLTGDALQALARQHGG